MPGTIESKASQLSKVLRSYFALVYVAVFSTMAMFWHFAQAESIQVMLFIGATSAAYAALYTALPVALTLLAGRACVR